MTGGDEATIRVALDWVAAWTFVTALIAVVLGMSARAIRKAYTDRPDGKALDIHHLGMDFAHGLAIFPFLMIMASVFWPKILVDVVNSNSLILVLGAFVGTLHSIAGICRSKKPE